MLGNKCQIFSLQARVRALVFALFSKNLTSGPGLWLLLPIEIISGSGKVGLSNKQMCCFFQLVVRPKKFGYFNFTAAEVEYRDNEDITVSEKRTALSSEPGQGLIIALKDYERQFSAHTVKSAKPCHSRPSQVKIWEVVVAQMVQLLYFKSGWLYVLSPKVFSLEASSPNEVFSQRVVRYTHLATKP